jgi:hypothetical protein
LKKARRRLSLYSLALLSLSLSARGFAQDERGLVVEAGKFSCTGVRVANPLDPYSAMSVARMPKPPADFPKNTDPLAFSGFDESRYGFNAVEFYQVLVGAASGDESDQSLATSTSLRLYLRTMGPSSETWYRLNAKDPTRLYADQPAEDVDETAAGQATGERKPTGPPAVQRQKVRKTALVR